MLLQRMTDGWSIATPAKVNLHLEVLGRRDDGYHDLDTILVAIDRTDRLTVRRSEAEAIGLRVEVPQGGRFPAHWKVPADATNLVVRALECLRAEWGVTEGLDVVLEKSIPAQAGLGGGSSDAAAALVAGMLVLRGAVDWPLAHRLAASLGSDINFFLTAPAGRLWAARAVGRGEVLEPIASARELEFLVFQPEQTCSTREVFALVGHSHAKVSSDAWKEWLEVPSDARRMPRCFNRLEMELAGKIPWVQGVQRAVEELAGEEEWLGNSMSGSGAAFFIVDWDRSKLQRLQQRLMERLQVDSWLASSWTAPSVEHQLRELRSGGEV
ncbi:MAG: 4-(cytidine 5'-diphospho)-2-C-methyl-D-erythritol kinase [Pirellulaceae bacterium]